MSTHLNQTPRTITESSQNESTSVGHTHAINKASVTQAGIVKLVDNLDSTSKTEALTANQGRELAKRLNLLAQFNGSKEINERLESALSYLATRYTAAYATYETAKDSLGKHPENSLIYVVNDTPLSADSTVQSGVITDWVHFGQDGRDQYVEPVCAWVANKFT